MSWNYMDDIRKYEALGYLKKKTLYEELFAEAEKFGEKTAVIDSKGSFTYRQLIIEIDRYAEHFYALGMRRGDHVILQMPNSNLFVVVLFGLMKIGVQPILMLTAQRSQEVLAVSRITNPVAYISVSDYMGVDYTEVIAPVIEQIPSLHFILIDGIELKPGMDQAVWKNLSGLKAREQPKQAARYDDTALYLLSGGTTGTSKIIPKLQEAYAYNAKSAAERCRLDESTVYMAVLPVSHDLALANPGILGTLLNGGTVVLCQSASFDEAFAMIEQHRVTMTTIVPAIIRVWAEVLDWYEGDFSSMRQLFVGAAKIDRFTLETLEKRMGVKLQQGYGLGEGITCATSLDDDREVIYGTQGTPVSPADEMRIIGPDGRILPNGEEGELIEKGPYTFSGYYGNEELNKKCFTEDGFFHTGDRAVIRPDGNLVILGRVVEQINRAGENVVPSEVEAILMKHPKIREACVFGVPDEKLGEATVACLIADEPLKRSEICEYMEEAGVASYKYPDRIVLLDHFIYKNVGKVDKNSMRELVEKGE